MGYISYRDSPTAALPVTIPAADRDPAFAECLLRRSILSQQADYQHSQHDKQNPANHNDFLMSLRCGCLGQPIATATVMYGWYQHRLTFGLCLIFCCDSPEKPAAGITARKVVAPAQLETQHGHTSGSMRIMDVCATAVGSGRSP